LPLGNYFSAPGKPGAHAVIPATSGRPESEIYHQATKTPREDSQGGRGGKGEKGEKILTTEITEDTEEHG
jgi:hypothetical protein